MAAENEWNEEAVGLVNQKNVLGVSSALLLQSVSA